MSSASTASRDQLYREADVSYRTQRPCSCSCHLHYSGAPRVLPLTGILEGPAMFGSSLEES